MISPYIKVNDDFIARISDACMLRKIHVSLVCREKDLSPIEREKLKNIPNLILNFNERVHAKCFYNEDTMVITSLNLYNSSSGDNREMGVLLKNNIESDKEAFEEARREAQFILREFMPKDVQTRTKEMTIPPKTKNMPKSNYSIEYHKENKRKGSLLGNIVADFVDSGSIYTPEAYCIRCGDKIVFNSKAPYCTNCFKSWIKHPNDDHEENYCLKCREPIKTSKRQPFCAKCVDTLG
jgi:hypothetical protein